MRKAVVIPLLFLFIVAAFAQKPKPKPAAVKPSVTAAKPKSTPTKPKTTAKTTPKPKVQARNPELEKAEFEKAAAIADPAEKIKALQKYVAAYPKSDQITHALELIVTSRAILADQKLEAHDTAAGIALFKLAVKEGPAPIPDKLFEGIVANFPTNLFYQGQRAAAVELAQLIEVKAGDNPRQLLSLAAFYIGIEQAGEAKRIADKIILLDPAMPDAYQTLALAQRMNFQPDESAAAYAKALELKPDSVISKRSLAEMKRSVGKTDEAEALYREILAANADDAPARTGLVLCLFDSEKKTEAESEMAKALEKEPNNLPLLAGAAYWYAAHDQGDKAVELAQKAIEVEPRYIWSHIALARGFMSKKKPLEAERVLLSARQYGNFPTLEYEIASARLMAGFYRDAVDELEKSFSIKDGMIQAKLGGRVPKESKSFIELMAFERRASIFEPLAADNPESAGKLKALLDLRQRLAAAEPNEAEAVAVADDFISGDDKMKFHRQLYVASLLLQKKIALAKVLDVMKAAAGASDSAVDGPNVTSAVLADQLYESRAISMARNQLVLVPEVPRQTLSAIVRGRIEDITGWAMFQQGERAGAIVHLRRAVSVLPDKSAWWRASLWKLAAALEADGKEKEALDSYIKSYVTDRPDGFKYITIESLYRKMHGNADGLEARIGVNPAPVVATQKEPPTPEAKTTPEVKTESTPETSAPTKKDDEAPKTETPPEVKTDPTPGPPPKAETTPEPTPEASTVADGASKPPAETKSDPVPADKPAETAGKPKPKDLFDPVVITVPSAEPGRARNMPPNPPAETESKKPDKSGAERPRVVEEKAGAEAEAPKCSITFSQESVSLISDGGSIGILVGVEGEGDANELKAISSSPNDIAIDHDPGIGGRRKAFFVIKSISRKIGLYTVTFEGPCGKREITVKVN